jgi:hypothetical protein
MDLMEYQLNLKRKYSICPRKSEETKIFKKNPDKMNDIIKVEEAEVMYQEKLAEELSHDTKKSVRQTKGLWRRMKSDLPYGNHKKLGVQTLIQF